jgi:hypothetical protein
MNRMPSPRPALALIATVVGGDTVSTEYNPPGIFTRASGGYITAHLELEAASGIAGDLPPGEIGVVLVDALPDDVKLARALADELARLGRSVVRLKPADLTRTGALPPIVLWVLPRAGGLESVEGEHMSYEASVRVVALTGKTRRVIFARSLEGRGSRERVSDILGVLDDK